MNALDKMKIEHARYKKALADIQLGVYGREPSAIALEALHPVQRILPPVTLEEILAALKKLNERSVPNWHSIRFYSDASGNLYNENDIFDGFNSLREALDKLEATGV